jgi:hypothetical protein
MKVNTLIDSSFTSKTLWILAFVLVTPLMILAPAAFTTEVAVQTTKLPLSQLAELILPFIMITFCFAGMIGAFLHRQSMSWLSVVWLMVSFLALGLLAMGQGIHFSAQTLNHFVITNRIFNELRDVAYLFNERLTHLIWLPPILSFPSIIAGWELLTHSDDSKPSPQLPNLFLGSVAGGWYGLVTALAILEAQLAKFAIQGLIALLVVGVITAIVKKKLFSLGSIINIVSLGTMLMLILLWRLRYGGFPEPLDILL